MNKKIVFTVVFLAFCALASAQDTSWSLTRCMETGLQKTIEIKNQTAGN
jgi:outer membrane protein